MCTVCTWQPASSRIGGHAPTVGGRPRRRRATAAHPMTTPSPAPRLAGPWAYHTIFDAALLRLPCRAAAIVDSDAHRAAGAIDHQPACAATHAVLGKHTRSSAGHRDSSPPAKAMRACSGRLTRFRRTSRADRSLRQNMPAVDASCPARAFHRTSRPRAASDEHDGLSRANLRPRNRHASVSA